ncbi:MULTISPECIES: ectonucleotide pyrophosphatase/phosphodiesterase [unclassified Enterococcus]|uniref:alkaline phosphatase family protein n=1 Tax=unclassified Enterococcus TaxID=2608891 RepID=UPI001554EC04|nr:MULTISPECIES: ectonucleotide pyrophosphatase/phosphodiesterase [unclassified Enterococcus]MBS7576991.1 alkaline phosphatase family protein [Enterococcus sp. MMGLQ5-2]MBS7584562.1 alkaline phosphatase family protein [Enterococcus sp. MMGLQ5-1]NPD12417.1 alkaline phosphatase family protein [Enterococcus sp. MMGLQ5-1]NPD36825.1 alkaline phosphatase family protein [Enterococcus sp. MMGLQ5-2]
MTKLVVISLDALGAADLKGDLADLPTIQSAIADGCHVEQVEAIYPSLTYPSHTTIMTGFFPNIHGIVNNTKLQSKRKSPDWFWYAEDIQVPTIFDYAKRHQLKTAAFLWPVCAKAAIDFNIAEIFPNRIWTNQVLTSFQASSSLFLVKMNARYGKLRQGINQPYLDQFITACTVDTIIHEQPDLTAVHLVNLDSMRHAHGVNSPEAETAKKQLDENVAKIIEATKIAGTYSDTVFVLLGDHYQIDVHSMIRINVLFAKMGWLTVRSDGTVAANWDVYCKSCDGSAYVYLNPKSDITVSEIRAELHNIHEIAAIYSHDRAESFGADPNCTLMLEAKRGYYFIDESVGQPVEKVDAKTIGQSERYRAVHGFSPEKENYQTTLVAFGPGIAKGKKIAQARLVDEAPTFAKILNLTTFPTIVDGQVINELFE